MLNLWSKNLILTSSEKIPTEPITFNYTGTVQTYTVPKKVKKVHIDMIGGAGYGAQIVSIGNASIPSAYGGRVECDLDVTNISLLYVYVGGSASNGFNSGTSAVNLKNVGTMYGAGATDIRTIKGDLHSRLVVAGGGGSLDGGPGGLGGGLVGGRGWDSVARQAGSYGGTQTAGGAAVDSYTGIGSNGGFGYGGAGYGGTQCNGGAGWYGGGGSPNANGGSSYGSGGGSSYTHPNLCTNVIHTQGYRKAVGDGWLVITPVA